MQFYKKTRSGALSGLGKLLIKIIPMKRTAVKRIILKRNFPKPVKEPDLVFL